MKNYLILLALVLCAVAWGQRYYTPNLPYGAARTVWDDLRVPVIRLKTGGINDPTFAQFQDDGSGSTGVYAWDFGAGAEEELFFTVQLPHGYALGTDLRAHVHWVTKTATATGTVIWGLEYTIANQDDAFATTSTIAATYTFDGDVQYDHIYTEFASDISGAGIDSLSSMLVCRLYRDVGTDTYADSATLLEFDLHLEFDAGGSTEKDSK